MHLFLARINNPKVQEGYKSFDKEAFKIQINRPETSLKTKIYLNLLLQNIDEANTLADKYITEIIEVKDYKRYKDIFEIVEFLSSINIESISKTLKVRILYFGSLVGAIKSLYFGLTRAQKLLFINLKNIAECNQMNHLFPFEPLFQLIKLQQAKKDNNIINTSFMMDIQNMNDENAQKFIIEMLNSLDEFLSTECPLFRKKGIYPFNNIGTHLPSNIVQKKTRISVFSGNPIKGASYIFRNTNLSIAVEEAEEWAFTNQFSPLNDGTLINPF